MRALLRELVDVNSFTDNVAGVDAACSLLKRALEPLPLSFETRRGTRYGTHLRAYSERAAAAQKTAVLLIGHTDTVFPPGVFDGYREDDTRAYGPGVLDMKGGLVVAVFALRALEAGGLLGRIPVELVAVADEETGSFESRELLVEAAPRAACALVLESGRAGDAIITARKGTAGLTAVAHGRAAHAGNLHHQGVNAIWALAKLVDAAQSLTDYGRGVTVNVGKLEGGQGKNTVPDRAQALIDFRFVHPADGDVVLSALRAAAETAQAQVPGSRIELTGGLNRPPLAPTEASRALYREVAECQRAAGLGDAEAPLLGGGSDANTMADLGVPAVDGLGPRGAGFHTREEYIELASLVPKTESLVRFLARRAS
jgi:glutamate carboxypeptidase